jgi:GTP cyclohydrolase III
LLNKEYKGSMDIVTAYKSLKQAVVKLGALRPHLGGDPVQNNKPGTSVSGSRKGYLKTTIAA